MSELSHLGHEMVVYTCYEYMVFAPIVISEGREFPLKSAQEELCLKISTGYH